MLANLLPLGVFAMTLTTVTALPGVGDSAAVAACRGFPNGVIKCLTDVSYTICRGTSLTGHGTEIEYYVAPGTLCEQGTVGVKKDAENVFGIATATRSFTQYSTGGAVMQPPRTGVYNDEQVKSWFLTTATSGMVRPTPSKVLRPAGV